MPSTPSLLERVRGKRTTDIELPNDTGDVDRRLQPRGRRRSPNLYADMGRKVQKMTRSVKRGRR